MVNKDSQVIGVVGLGYMGCSIVSAFLMWGYKVIAIASLDSDLETATERIRASLHAAHKQGIHNLDVDVLLSKLFLTTNYQDLKSCFLISENVVEQVDIKIQVLDRIESSVSQQAIITTNTSGIPISILQSRLQHPGRFLGMHWAEPAYTSPFLEIICGDKTNPALAESLYTLATSWGKEPVLLRKDIRGFVTNRLMYALYREALHLVDQGYATMRDIDSACKNDAGHWMTFCGPFRYMDLTGLQAYHHVMKDLFPTLSNQKEIPPWLDALAASGANGVSNGRGFYEYSPDEAAGWQKAYKEFKYNIYNLSVKYPADLVKQRLKKPTKDSGGDA